MGERESTSEHARFRITAGWPGDVIPVGEVEFRPEQATIDDEGFLVVDQHSTMNRGRSPLPPDFALREIAALDPGAASDQEILDFVLEWGWPLSPNNAVVRSHFRPAPGGHLTDEELERLDADGEIVISGDALAAHWRRWNGLRMSDVRGLLEKLKELGVAVAAFLAGAVDQTSGDEQTRYILAIQRLNDGLSTYHVGLNLVRTRAERSALPSRGFAGVSLRGFYDVACAQLYNMLVESTPVKRCDNCGALFTRQRDRAEHGQYRSTGVKYCTVACKRAAASRAYRARKRAEKNGDS